MSLIISMWRFLKELCLELTWPFLLQQSLLEGVCSLLMKLLPFNQGRSIRGEASLYIFLTFCIISGGRAALVLFIFAEAADLPLLWTWLIVGKHVSFNQHRKERVCALCIWHLMGWEVPFSFLLWSLLQTFLLAAYDLHKLTDPM